MLLVTNEYTTLVKDGEEVSVIKPNEPFGYEKLIEGATNTAWCTIKKVGSAEILFVLKPGQVIPPMKGNPKPDLSKLSVSELKSLCMEQGISYKAKATKTALIKLLGA